MSESLLVKSLQLQPLLSLNMRNINELFLGFTAGDFAVLYGTQSVLSLTSLLCVRAQLPTQLGGLGTDVVFIDGGNTFRLYQIARIAQIHQMDPKKVLECIYISRAFTAYQMTALIIERLKATVKRFSAKLVIISDIAGFFLDKDVPDEEARRIFSQVTAYLSNFAKENQITLIATYPPHQNSTRNLYLHALTCGRANTVISIKSSKYGRTFVLEKHPCLALGYAEFPSECITLTEFMEYASNGQNC